MDEIVMEKRGIKMDDGDIVMENSIRDKNEVIKQLQDHGISPTQQRVDIGQILFAKHQHLSAEQVLERVNIEQPNVSKATVYNTLKLFAGKGLIRELVIDPSRIFYDTNTTNHHHIYDQSTGHLIDVAPVQVDMSNLPELPHGMIQMGVDVVVRVRT